MANEFKIKNGLIVTGDAVITGNATVNGSSVATQAWVTSQGYLTTTPTLAQVLTAGSTFATTQVYSGTTEAIRPNVDSIGSLGASNFRWGVVYSRALSSGTNTLDINSPALNLNDTSGNIKVKLYTSTGNVVIQNGGTFTDAGYRFDVNGTARVQGNLTVSSLTVNGTVISNAGVLSTIAGYTGMVNIQQPAPMPPIVLDVQNGVIVNVSNAV